MCGVDSVRTEGCTHAVWYGTFDVFTSLCTLKYGRFAESERKKIRLQTSTQTYKISFVRNLWRSSAQQWYKQAWTRKFLNSMQVGTQRTAYKDLQEVECVWNLMAHGDAREGKWRGNWRMEWVASTLTLPRNVVCPALLTLMRTTRLPAVDWTDCPGRFKWTRPFLRKTKSGFCPCAITFQTHYTVGSWQNRWRKL